MVVRHSVRVKERTMTKSELIESVANKLKLPKGKAELIVNCVFDSMELALRNGERIEIRGFGSFEIRHYKAYEGRNPRTGTKVEVKPKRLPFFKVGKELKERVNDGRTDGVHLDDDDDDDDDDELMADEGGERDEVEASPSGNSRD
jgi:integration host factor subunit beta